MLFLALNLFYLIDRHRIMAPTVFIPSLKRESEFTVIQGLQCIHDQLSFNEVTKKGL